MIERMPPEADDVERAVLAAMLLDPACIPTVRARLSAADFRLPVHGVIAEAIYDLADSGQAVDLVTVNARLATDAVLTEAGGASYLARVYESTPTTANVQDHAEVVADRALRRDVLRRLDRARGELCDLDMPGTVTAARLISDLQAHEVRRTPDAGLLLAEALDRITTGADATDCPTARLPIVEVQSIVGGLRPGWQVVLAGTTGSGKTSYALQVAALAATDGLPVRVFSLEMTGSEVARRLLSQDSGCRLEPTPRGLEVSPATRVDAYRVALERLRRLPITVDDAPRLSLADIYARCERQKRGGGLGLVIIDYLQLLVSPQAENRTRELELLSRNSKLMARALAVPVVLLSQLSRLADHEGRPRMAHLKGSGSLEQDADLVLLMHRPDPQAADEAARRQAFIIVEKNRHGPIGTIEAEFEGQCTRFAERNGSLQAG